MFFDRWYRSGVLLAISGTALAVQSADSDFQTKVLPVLDANCIQCHAESVKTSGFSTATMQSVISGGNKYGKAVLGGAPEKSPLLRVLKGELTPRMPFGKVLPESDISKIEAWVRNLKPELTSTDEQWRWSYRKPVKEQPPKVANSSWVTNPIDAFILKKLEDLKLQPAALAAKRVLARRLYFDLLGVPPTVNEMNSFLGDPSNDAYRNLVDTLLADPRYGERWGRHWLDLVRYAETDGMEADQPIGNVWRYRDWVINAFNADMPYDKFVIQQLAGGDEQSRTGLISTPDIQSYIPVAFLRFAPWEGGSMPPEENRQIYLDEITSVTGSVFLGMTVGCARCHDHKYDPIPTEDYYRLQAFFNTIKIEDVDVPFKDKAFVESTSLKIKEFEQRLKSGLEKRELDDFEEILLKRLIAIKTEEAKKGELTVQDLRLELRRADQKLFSEPEKERQQDLLQTFVRTQDPEDKTALADCEKVLLMRLAQAVAASTVEQAARYTELTREDLRVELSDQAQKAFSGEEREHYRHLLGRVALIRMRIARLQPRVPSVINVPGPPNGPGIPDTHVLIRGELGHLGRTVEAGFPSVITGNSNPATIEIDRYRQYPTRGRRLTLAKWIASPDNPLTARVIVNRIWQHHFGRGIVETASDFGRNGTRPTHPALLDWLAVRLMEDKWSIKAIHRLILNSSTYRQASENPGAEGNKPDPDDTLLWRFRRRRLDAEEVRDSILWVSGWLSLARGGPSVFPPLPLDLADLSRGVSGLDIWETNEKDEDNRRRSIYTFQRRSLPQPMMLAFDAPVFSESCERRSVTTTALQALSMMNGDLVNQESVHLAERVAAEAGGNREVQIGRTFEIVLNRLPKPAELEKFTKFPGSLVEICRILLSSNEFVYVD